MTDTQLVTQKEAAALAGVARSTIIRARQSGKLPNSQQDQAGRWLIPVSDLIQAHMLDTVTKGESTMVSELSIRVRELEQQLDLERVRRESAEKDAHRLENNLDDVRRSLRMLESGFTTIKDTHQHQPSPQSENQPRKRWWWKR